MEIDEVTRNLNVTREGLTSQEAQERLKKYGYNEFRGKKRRTAFQMFLEGFKDVFILLLLAAAMISGFIGYYEYATGKTEQLFEALTDTITIGAIAILVAITGFVQEYRAEKAVEALRKLAAPRARVLRDGKETVILSKEVVLGDILVLEAGDLVPADARLLGAIELKADEAVLTGESVPCFQELGCLAHRVIGFRLR